jgi:dienelactone hydrolase
VQTFIRQNVQQYPFMNQTGLHGNITIDKDEFEGLYWKGRTRDLRPLWQRVLVPTLALYGEDDDHIDPAKNMSLLAGFDNPRITTKLFPRASHALKKAFNPATYPDIDWPRRIDASYEVVAQWIGQNILGRQPR